MKVGDVIMENDALKVVTPNGLMTMTNDTEELMEQWIMNRVTFDHKIQEQELMKVKEVEPNFADLIKENVAKNISRDIVKKVTFTKKYDKDADVHHFIGRVWCFTDEELKQFVKEVRNA